jgi:hypothetical protein
METCGQQTPHSDSPVSTKTDGLDGGSKQSVSLGSLYQKRQRKPGFAVQFRYEAESERATEQPLPGRDANISLSGSDSVPFRRRFAQHEDIAHLKVVAI